MGKLRNLIYSNEIREKGKSMLENLTVALLSGDVIAIGNLLRELVGSPYFIREEIFWQNFIEYLDNACDDEDDLRKLSEVLAEDGNSNENAKRLLKIIDDIGTRRKAIYWYDWKFGNAYFDSNMFGCSWKDTIEQYGGSRRSKYWWYFD